MNDRLTNEEKVLQILNDKIKDAKTNSIHVYKSDFSPLDMVEADITRSLYLLQASNMLVITKSSPKNDLSMPWTIALNSTGVHYFENKSKKYKTERRDQIKTYIPISISMLALIKSSLPEIISTLKLLVQLLK